MHIFLQERLQRLNPADFQLLLFHLQFPSGIIPAQVGQQLQALAVMQHYTQPGRSIEVIWTHLQDVATEAERDAMALGRQLVANEVDFAQAIEAYRNAFPEPQRARVPAHPNEEFVLSALPWCLLMQNLDPNALQNMGSPPPDVIAPAGVIDAIHFSGEELQDEIEEVTIHYNAMVSIEWLNKAIKTSLSVAKMSIPAYEQGQPSLHRSGQPRNYEGTGWLLGERLLITNYHVLKARGKEEHPVESDLRLQGKHGKAIFDFDSDGEMGIEVAFQSLLVWEKELDYAVVELAETTSGAAHKRQPLCVCKEPLMLSPIEKHRVEPVNIIQHPDGSPKKIAFRKNNVSMGNEQELRYYTDTEKGSSGSPVCDDQWRAIALHRGANRLGGETKFYQGRRVHWVNVGTQMATILDNIKSQDETLYQRIIAEQDQYYP